MRMRWTLGGPLLLALALLTHAAGCAGTPAGARAPEETAAAAVVPPPPPPHLRLGDAAARPERYRVELTVDPARDDFQGVAELDVVLKAPTSLLYLNGSELTVQEAVFTVGEQRVPARVQPQDADVLGLVPERPLPAGRATVRLRYTGKVSPRDSSGIFRQRDGEDWYAYTQFEPGDARRAFPSFDEPAFKVPFQLTLRVRPEHRALSNTPVLSEEVGADGLKVVRFAETLPLPTYLVAFAVGPFDVVEAGTAGQKRTAVRIVVPRGHAAGTAWAARTTGPLLEVLERYFGIPYPYEKLDVVAVPITTGWGAMENPGLITWSMRLIVAAPGTETEGWRRTFAETQAHELAHQWFGNLVTTAWWDDIWLNEAFATWMASKALQTWQPTWGAELEAVRDRGYAMGADSLVTARRIRQPIQVKGDIEQAFDGITYVKGALVLRMFEAFLGEETFRRGVQEHLRRHAHGNATADDFLTHLSSAAGRDVRPMLSSFLEQPGVPRVAMALVCEAGAAPALQLSQQRYLPLGSTGQAGQTWQVPVCVRYGRGADEAQACTLLTGERGSLPLEGVKGCPEWVVPNAGMKGYYRAHLQGDLLTRLTRDGGRRLSLAERIGLLGDVQALTRSGDLPAAEALALLPRLVTTDDRDLLTAAVQVVQGVREDLIPASLRPNYARFVRKVFGARARRLGLTPEAGEREDTTLLRPVLVGLVALQGEDPVLRAGARRLAQAWLKDRRAVTPDMLGVVLQVVAEDGDAGLQEQLLAAARETPDRRVRQQVLRALGAVRAPALAQRNMAAVLSDGLDIRDAMTLVQGTLVNPSTRAVAYGFVKEHFDTLVQRLPRHSGAELARTGSHFCDPAHRADVAAFFGARAPKYEGGPRVLAQTLEQVDLCIAQREAHTPGLTAFLARQ